MKKINFEAVMAGSAIFIGLCALFVSINQTRIMRLQHEASIWPHVYHSMSYRDSGRFVYTVRNVGLGPAKIINAQIIYREKTYSDYYPFLSDFLEIPVDSVERNIPFGYSSLNGRVLSPGEKVEAMIISNPEVSGKLFYGQEEWSIKICYSSISNKYWESFSFQDAKEVKNCE